MEQTYYCVSTRYGEFYLPFEDDLISNALREYGEWAQSELEILCDFIEAGDVVIDGGACFGTHARAFSERVGVSGKVICFEPVYQNREILEQNARVAPIQNMEVWATALGSAQGRTQAIIPISNNGGARLFCVDTSVKSGVKDIEVVTLDDAVSEPVNFIKLDLERSEEAALMGAERILSTDRPVVFAEVLDIETGVSLYRYMTSRGYLTFGINTPAFRKENFNNSNLDIFAGGTECGLLFLNAGSRDKWAHAVAKHQLSEIETLDDLVLLLLGQPQYVETILSSRPAAIGLSLPSLRSQQQIERQLSDEHELREQHQVHISNLAKKLNDEHELRDQNQIHISSLAKKLEAFEPLLEEWESLAREFARLAKRARAFPFALYFRLNTRHRRSTRKALTAPERPRIAFSELAAMRLVISKITARNCGDFEKAEVQTIQGEIPHPIGWKAEMLSSLAPVQNYFPEYKYKALEVWLSQSAVEDLCPSEKGLILALSHDNYLTVPGGTQLCVSIEAKYALEKGFDYVHVFPRHPASFLAAPTSENAPLLGISINGVDMGATSYEVLRKLIKQRTNNNQMSMINIHHMMGHVPEYVSYLIKEASSGSVTLWLHDFFALCQSPHLLRNNVTFCGATDLASASCTICCYSGVRGAHLSRYGALFNVTNLTVVAPSKFVANVFLKKTDWPYKELIIQPHLQIYWRPMDKAAERHEAKQMSIVKVAFVGAPALHKGWQNFLQLAQQLKYDPRFQFHYFGSHCLDTKSVQSHLVTTTGADPNSMVSALRENEIDIVVHVSNTPETFSFTAHEAIASGAQIVTSSSSGNVALVVRELDCGVVLETEKDLTEFFEGGKVFILAKRSRELRGTRRAEVRIGQMTFSARSVERSF